MIGKERVKKIVECLEKMYPEAACSLDYTDPLQLMVATQLAAQCTDARVNIVTKDLFEKYKTVYDFADAYQEELEQYIRSTGFYRNKAKNIIAACKMIISDFGGKVPQDMESLLKLPGVGRKTANLLLNDCFGIPGIVVDTHAKRLSNRIGLTKNQDPEKIEYDLMKQIPRDKWGSFCHQLVYHGRAVCNARKPLCDICDIKEYCDYGKKAASKPKMK
ncbi:MAG: endonuclease III [Clostridiaceae bacterium]|nr:endonuclease III [Clostridiaceae bacterium]